MIIDCHGHYTTEPQQLHDFRKKQVEAAGKKEHIAVVGLKI
jgi:4-oxalmesaconate hydratase